MRIRSRLTLLFTIINAAILLLFAIYIYSSSAGNRREAFFIQLRKESMTRANLLFDTGVDAETLQTIYLQDREIMSPVEVAIYDTAFNLLYHDAEGVDFLNETPEMIQLIVEKEEIRFTQEGWEVIGMLFDHNDKQYVITAAAYDEYGQQALRNLRGSLFIALLAATVVTYFAGRYFSDKVLKPVSRMASKAGSISATNLHLRLKEDTGRDELAELASTFNQMLDRLEQSFDAQREFVSNIAHELRTPLSAVIGEAELALSGQKLPAHCQSSFENILKDTRRLSRLGTGLMDMAKASYETHQISQQSMRLDEVIMDARLDILNDHPDYKINMHVDESLDDESQVTMQGNFYLLKVAFANLMDNACKFSGDKTARITLRKSQNGRELVVTISDRGIGIPAEDLQHVFNPFYRGKNSTENDGSGIGLSLVQRIIRLHNADIELNSTPGKGTDVHVKVSIKPVTLKP
ncbi:MAG: HAMP domain-containing protein [Bacteroidia bacterium]|nr:MAG: HAMP domain-containing protein [Bacteroidia bacterium]